MTPLKKPFTTSISWGCQIKFPIYVRSWANHSPTGSNKYSAAFWNMQSVIEHMKGNTINCRNGQLCNEKLAYMRKQAYMPGQGIAKNSVCPLCRQEDSGGHNPGGCLHRDMKKQYTASHDKAMRAVLQACTKSKYGSFYLIAHAKWMA